MKKSSRLLSRVLVMSLCGVASSAASFSAEPILPDFVPREAIALTDAQLALVKDHDARTALEADGSGWNEIKGWRALGARWAAALDANGKTIGLYDLSLPAAVLPGFAVFGRIGGPDFTTAAARDLLAEARSAARDKKKLKKIEAAIAALDKHAGSAGRSLMPDDWAKKVPWTKAAEERFALEASKGAAATAPRAFSPPLAFSLSDIDYTKAARHHGKRFAKSMAYLARFGVDLSAIGLVRRADGAYDLTYDPKRAAAGLQAEGLARPSKLADPRDRYEGFWWSVERAVAVMVVGFAVDQIPDLTTQAILGTVLNRYLSLHFDVYAYHREAAREMVEAAVRGESPYSAFASLSPDELKGLGIDLYLAQFNIASVWDWLWHGAAGAYNGDLIRNQANAAAAEVYYKAYAEDATDLNPRFAVTSAEGRHHVVLSSARYWLDPNTPAVAIDYDHPGAQLAINAAVETASTAMHFAGHYIPLVGSLVPTVFDWIERDPVQHVKYWEAHLLAHLEDRELVARESWSAEIKALLAQRINPFDLSEGQSRAFVDAMAAGWGIDRSLVAVRPGHVAN